MCLLHTLLALFRRCWLPVGGLLAASALMAGCSACRRDERATARVDEVRVEPTKPASEPLRGRSLGCGKVARGTGEFEAHSLQIDDSTRHYHVRLPASYDPARAYPLVFRFHGTGGTGLSHGLDIEAVAPEDAIVAAIDGRDGTWTWASGPEDLRLFDAAYAAISDGYCIDLGRVFAYGFSAGGGVTNALGCVRAARLRGIAVVAGFDVKLPCELPVAAWFLHDRDDDRVSIAQGEAARARMRERNGCTEQAVERGEGCRSYEGCRSGYPVVWCETRGHGHDIAGDTAPARVWSFFSALP